MKNNLLLSLVILFVHLNLFSQTQGGGLLNQVDEKGRKQGMWMKYHDDSDSLIRYTGSFVNDVPVDTFKHYYRNGKLQSVVVHDAGGYARVKNYYPNGVLMAEGRYQGELKDSSWNYYNNTRQLIATEFYITGKKYGTWKVYHDNGNLARETYWENNLQNGPCIDYFRNGNVKSDWTYHNGSVEGEGKFYHENGKLWKSGQYHHDAKNGKWSEYDENGELIGVISYNKGIPEGGIPELKPEDTSKYLRKDKLDEFDFYPDAPEE